MKLSATRLYVEDYVKCRNCGILIYDAGRPDAVERGAELFCTQWCVEWFDKRAAEKASAGSG